MTHQLTFEEDRDPECPAHAHCPFCGGLMAEYEEWVACVACGTAAPIAEIREQTAS